jgi:raffinose/stachyose/melibiose transport system permease protein
MIFRPYHKDQGDDKPDQQDVSGMFDIIDSKGEHKVEPHTDAASEAAKAEEAKQAEQELHKQQIAHEAQSISFDAAEKAGKPIEVKKAAADDAVDFSVAQKPETDDAAAAANVAAAAAAADPKAAAAKAAAEAAAKESAEKAAPAAESVDFSAVRKPVQVPHAAAPAAAHGVDFSAAQKPQDPQGAAGAAGAAPVAGAAVAHDAAAPVASAKPVATETAPAANTARHAAPAAATPTAPAAAAPAAATPVQPAHAAPVASEPASVAQAPAAPKPAVVNAAAAPAATQTAAPAQNVAPAPAAPAAAAPATAAVATATAAAPAAATPAKKHKKNKKKSDDESFGKSGILNQVKHSTFWTVFFTILSLAWIYPIFLVFYNSFKDKVYISSPHTFEPPTSKSWVGLENYTRGVERTNLIASFGWTVFITVGAVALILVCTSMCAWWIVRVNNRFAKLIYTLFLFNMIVPFQMVMYPLSKLANMLSLDTPWGLWIVYLGFGAGLSVFMFTGVIKGLPAEIEESAMIDGASVPKTFFGIVWPMMRPSMVSVAILQTMWIWNDYLLPYLILDMKRYKTLSIAVQYLKGGYGSVDMGAMMGCLVLAMLPIIIFYLVCQKYIIAGVTAGAVKG